MVLGGIAPHIDDWLSRTSGIKSSFVEIQLANISARQQLALPKRNRGFPDQTIFPLLAGTGENIGEDLIYIQFQINDPRIDKEKKKQYLQMKPKMESLKKLIDDIVTPIAGCVRDAVERGFSRESVRHLVARAADLTAEIIELTDLKPDESKLPVSEQQKRAQTRNEMLGKAREELKQQLKGIGQGFQIPGSWNPGAGCFNSVQLSNIDDAHWRDFLNHQNYGELPYYSIIITESLGS